jgi:hypothetical protein
MEDNLRLNKYPLSPVFNVALLFEDPIGYYAAMTRSNKGLDLLPEVRLSTVHGFEGAIRDLDAMILAQMDPLALSELLSAIDRDKKTLSESPKTIIWRD